MTDLKKTKNLPHEKAFYFFTSLGNYTGKSASSLQEFKEKILEVDIKSLEFHLDRGDFQKWIRETLDDRELAQKIQQLKETTPMETILRDRLYSIVSKHYIKLQATEKRHKHHHHHRERE